MTKNLSENLLETFSENLTIYFSLFQDLLKIRKLEKDSNLTLWDLIEDQTDTEILLNKMDIVWKLLTIKEIEYFEKYSKEFLVILT